MIRRSRYTKEIGSRGELGFRDRKTGELRAVVVPKIKGKPKSGGVAFPAFSQRYSRLRKNFGRSFFNIRRLK